MQDIVHAGFGCGVGGLAGAAGGYARCPPVGAFALLPVGRMCEVTEPGPKRWTTIPEGGGVGSGRASAGSAQRDANIAVDRSLNFKDFLR